MQKKWIIANKIADDNPLLAHFDKTTSQLLLNRGIIEHKEIEFFFKGSSENVLHDPFLFSAMHEVAEKIIENIKARKKICIYGDFDADGITSCAVLYETFKTLKAEVDIYIPDRVTEGYGMHKSSIDEVVKTGAELIITVDTGIRNKDEIAYAKSKGLEVILTDHHIPPAGRKDWPDCLIINPSAPGEAYPFKPLAGVGVAYKLACAIIRKTKLNQELKDRLEERVLDLVAIGTVADCVALLGENRAIVRRGLELLPGTRRAGLKALFETAQIDTGKSMDSWNIGFQIGPRLNAAGRLDHANTAFELLVTKSEEDAKNLAQSLNENNSLRQSITDAVVEEIALGIEGSGLKKKIIVAVSPNLDKEGQCWNEGITGLAASKIADRFFLPTIVITRGAQGLKGSGRSIPGYNLVKAVEQAKEYLTKFGGHPAACGIALKPGNLDEFKEKIEAIADNDLDVENLVPRLNIDMEIELSEADEELFKTMSQFAPFGQGNEQPRFASRNVLIVDIITMGNASQHIKFRVKSESSGLKTALAFFKAQEYSGFKIGDKVDIAYFLDLNGFNGRTEVQLKLADIKIAGSD